jgi:broad specificity phosphatase PhoE
MAAAAVSSYRQVHVLTRHGARERLEKTTGTTTTSPPEEKGGRLTAVGENQMERLGLWLQRRYNGQMNLTLSRVSSSSTQRTIVSAMALSRGFTNLTLSMNHTMIGFTEDHDAIATTVPVYSTEEVNDIYIRPYDKCPNFSQHLANLYERDETWIALEESVQDILRRLATIPRYKSYADDEGMMIPLENVWNVFDDIMVCQSAGEEDEDCLRNDDDKPMLTTDEWTRLQKAVHGAELAKYHSSVAGELIGRNLLLRIVATPPPPVPPQQPKQQSGLLFVYSGHYPTLLGVLAALDVTDFDNPDDDEINHNVIPSFASALLIEEHMDGHVELHYKSGDDDGTDDDDDSSSAWLLRSWNVRDDFVQSALGGSSSSSLSDNGVVWCKACDNRSADVCLAYHHRRFDGPSLNSTVAGFVLGCGVGALLVMAYLTFRPSLSLCCRRRTGGPRRGGRGRPKEQEQELPRRREEAVAMPDRQDGGDLS